jgi:hypothetical protein
MRKPARTTEREVEVLGHRVYLEMPKEPDSNVILDQATKSAIEQENLRRWGHLRVVAKGAGVTEVEVGDIVMIDPLSVNRSCKVPLSATKTVLMVSVFDIAHIWR